MKNNHLLHKTNRQSWMDIVYEHPISPILIIISDKDFIENTILPREEAIKNYRSFFPGALADHAVIEGSSVRRQWHNRISLLQNYYAIQTVTI